MFKRLLCVVFVLTLCACSSEPAKDTATPEPAPTPKPAVAELWTVTEGIATPESAYIDPKSGEIYVSNIEGMPDQKGVVGVVLHVEDAKPRVDVAHSLPLLRGLYP